MLRLAHELAPRLAGRTHLLRAMPVGSLRGPYFWAARNMEKSRLREGVRTCSRKTVRPPLKILLPLLVSDCAMYTFPQDLEDVWSIQTAPKISPAVSLRRDERTLPWFLLRKNDTE